MEKNIYDSICLSMLDLGGTQKCHAPYDISRQLFMQWSFASTSFNNS